MTELRLAGGLDHAPCEIASGNSDLVPQAICPAEIAPERIGDAERKVRARLAGSRPSQHLHALAVLGLWGRQPGALDQSIAALLKAAGQEPQDAYILNDLGVAYTLRATRDQQPLDLLAALKSFEQATRMAPFLPEARFNLALTLERFSLRTDARIEWESYLQLETDSGWVREATQHLRALTSPTPAEQWEEDRQLLEQSALAGRSHEVLALVERHVQRARETVERELLRDWAATLSTDRPAEAAQALTVAREIAQALALHGERLPKAAIDAIDKAESRSQLERLAAGHLALIEGYRLYREARTQEALARLTEADDLLAGASSPARLWARYFEACAIYQSEDYIGSIRALDLLDKEAHGQSFLSLEAHISWMQGQNRLVSGRPLEALSFFRLAADRFLVASEVENGAAMRTLIGDSLDFLGRHREAWKGFYAALRATPEMRDPKRLFLTYIEAADACLRQDLPHLALRFQNEVVRQAARTRNPQLHADSLFWRGLMKEINRSPGVGRKDLEAARAVGESLTDEMARARFEADLAMVEGLMAASQRPEWAIQRLNEAIDFYDRIQLRVQSASLAHRARARAHRALGNLKLAEADLRTAMHIAEAWMSGGGTDPTRWALLEKPGDVFEEMIQFQLEDLGAETAAFDTAERARSLSLPILGLHKQFAPARLPLSSAAILKALPPRTILVQLEVLADRVCAWVLSPQGIELFQTPVQRVELLERIATWRKGGWKDNQGQPNLYNLLVQQWIPRIPADHLLVLIPDATLVGLPFAALRDLKTGRYLVEDFRLAISPSASLFILASGRRPPGSGPIRALALGNPAFDPREFSFLFPLPSAGEEARLVGEIYPDSTILIGADANRERFLASVQGAEILHIAGHALVNDLHPEQSMLLLAPSQAGGRSGFLLAREVGQLDLHRTHLVVLSGCQTGSAAEAPGEEGISSLAQAFLIAGAPTVIATLWKIDDRASSQLFRFFYRQLQAGHDPSRALQEAQLSLLHSDDSGLREPVNWAAFQVLGASRGDQPER